jgi:uncharacterized protein YehS (DUF1456 family)
MIHNDVLRRLRYALAINDTAAISIFKLVNYDMEIDYLHAVMKGIFRVETKLSRYSSMA